MKILYVNDLRDFPNWGCRATGTALSELIEMNHVVIDRIGKETGNNSGWHAFAEPRIRLNGVLPRFISDWSWRIRGVYPKISKLTALIDRFFGARHDFVKLDPKNSVTEFFAVLSRVPRLQEIYDSFLKSDAVIINGEGTLIFRKKMDRDAKFLLFIIELARQADKPCYLLNAMLSDSPISAVTSHVKDMVGRTLNSLDTITLRDESSLEIAKAIAPDANMHLIPDALFTWREKIASARARFLEDPIHGLIFEDSGICQEIKFNEPYICLAGTSLVVDKQHTIECFVNLVEELKSLNMQILLVETCVGDVFLRSVALRTNLPVLTYSNSVMTGAAIVSNATVFVTGRFHPSIMAATGGTPCVYFGSNSHKNLTLQKVLQYENTTHYSVTPSKLDCSSIVADVDSFVKGGDATRGKIFKRVVELDKAAKLGLSKVLDDLT
jgi:polysaccharide pyruvyl transferase WcaK-like protein